MTCQVTARQDLRVLAALVLATSAVIGEPIVPTPSAPQTVAVAQENTSGKRNATVPEPQSYFLIGGALVVMSLLRRRRRADP
jgi:hypothetical protein